MKGKPGAVIINLSPRFGNRIDYSSYESSDEITQAVFRQMYYAVSRNWRISSWDRVIITKLFARI